ncbi:EcsC family protein [Ectobacillus sp. JY-23]|uniref:EcsC family protein n=1 Tax=Ectobacillus sp. JY-23 TaxID=2933872 RepID=UPI001FF1FC77|nr:EcsC family protein [Ectobacillus sp. JY-23]UOY92064.1 EcsC family protein [Ectobacillus sp. JY-23]
MNAYEQQVMHDLATWKKAMLKESSLVNRFSKKVQTKVQELIPEKAHAIITETMKKMVQGIVVGTDFIQPVLKNKTLTLQERDERVKKKIEDYKRIAAVEGAGTGAGGILLGLADFPLLLTIKIKFLFDAATLYGYDTSKEEERLFLLHIFQLAFSSDEHRRDIFSIVENWEEEKGRHMDWRKFQQEYRDYIDFVKMLQLVPFIGAPVGAYANYNLLQRLGDITIKCYQMRWLNEHKG